MVFIEKDNVSKISVVLIILQRRYVFLRMIDHHVPNHQGSTQLILVTTTTTAAVYFLDALASLDFKLSVGQWVSESVIDIFFTAIASMGLSDFLKNILVQYHFSLKTSRSMQLLYGVFRSMQQLLDTSTAQNISHELTKAQNYHAQL